MGHETVFLGWGRPLVDLAVEKLANEWDEGFLDLSSLLLVVPTLGSGRRLRERIATFAAERGGAVLPARIVTPDFFLLADRDRRDVAPRVAELGAWMLALRQADPDEILNLFPVPPEDGDLRWAMAAAKKLSRLKKLLGENGLSISATLASQGELLAADSDRWREMAELERRYLDILAQRGLRDADAVKRGSMPGPDDLRQTSKIVLVGVTDPLPLLRRKFEAIAAMIPMEAWIAAPESLRGHFDAWGAPIPERWTEFRPPLRDFEDSVQLAGTPESQAEAAVEFLRSKGGRLDAASVAVMSPDEKLYPFLERAFARRGVATFNPAARRLGATSAYALLAAFRDLLAKGSYDAFAALARHPDFTGHCQRLYPEFVFSGLDLLQNKRLPVSFAAFKDALRRERGLDDDSKEKLKPAALDSLSLAADVVDQFAALFADSPFTSFVRGFLGEIHAGRMLDAESPGDNTFIEVAGLLNALLDELDASALADELPAAELFALFMDVLKDGLVYLDRPHDAFDIQGWLELAFEPAAVLVVCGLNEGFVPDKVEDDGFLPESVRSVLGLRDDRTRFARDAFLFSAALSWRRPEDVLCVVAKANANGDPLLPSRLLFLRDPAEMPAWALKLFADAPAGRPGPTQDAPAWLLTPEKLDTPENLPVTAFKQYLECPFRFYLKRVARMEKRDDRKMELDQLDFGNLCHTVMEGFGRALDIRGSRDGGEIGAWLQERLDAILLGLYGHDLPLALLIQREALRRRLAAVAAVQAADRAEGWEIVDVERELRVPFEGMTITGKIDRVDRRGDCFRLLDYKTSDTVKRPAPQASHYVAVRASAAQPAHALFQLDEKKTYRWLDLQLPLYRILTASTEPFKGHRTQCGYFSIPKALSDTGIEMWDGLDGVCLEAARGCAAAVVDLVKRGVFWPPAEKVPFDEFEELWTESPLASVEPGHLEVAP